MAHSPVFPAPIMPRSARTVGDALKMRGMRTSVAALLLLLAPMTAGAQFHDGLAPPDGNEEAGWSGRGELGLALSKGNTESESFLGKFDLAHVTSLRRHAFGASAQYASTDDIESARRYELHGTSGWR